MHRSLFLTAILTTLYFTLSSQPPHLDVEGHARIRGNLDIAHTLDTTSMFLGNNAGFHYSGFSTHRNTVVGVHANHSISVSGTDNVMMGYQTGLLGNQNAFFGTMAGQKNTGNRNVFSGYRAGTNNQLGTGNAFYGYRSGFYNDGGAYNTLMGYESGAGNVDGHSNVFIGANAGQQSSKGTRNTFIGRYADRDLNGQDSLDRAIVLGYGAKASCSNCAVIGGTGVDALKVGIGTAGPDAALHVHEINNTRLKISNENAKEIMIDLIRNDENKKDNDWRIRNAINGDFEIAYHATDLEGNSPTTVVGISSSHVNPGSNNSVNLGQSTTRWKTVWARTIEVNQLLRLEPISEPTACKSSTEGSIYYDKSSHTLKVCSFTGSDYKWLDLH